MEKMAVYTIRNCSIAILFLVPFYGWFIFTITQHYRFSCTLPNVNDGDGFVHRFGQRAPVNPDNYMDQDVIRIALVICSKHLDYEPREEAAVLIKSIIMSTIMNDISNHVEFHLFLEHSKDEIFFTSKLEEYSTNLRKAEVTLKFHSAKQVVSDYYHANMTNEERLRCMYVRIFIPKILLDIDSVMYMDTDFIVTGNLKHLWSQFYGMNTEQIIGVVPDFEPNNPKNSTLFRIGDVPFVPPKGVNSGLQLMNLTRMRAYGWTGKMMTLYNDYAITRGVKMKSDQKLTNILLFFSPSIMLQLPCQYNFWYVHCDEGLYCPGVFVDPVGIQVIHGAASGFSKLKPLGDIFKVYREFSLGNGTTKHLIRSMLMMKIRNLYDVDSADYKIRSKGNNRTRKAHKSCDGIINKFLFKHHFHE